jgi:hypothetical protein
MRAFLAIALGVLIGCGKKGETDSSPSTGRESTGSDNSASRPTPSELPAPKSPQFKETSIGQEIHFDDLSVTVATVTVQQFQTTDYTIYQPALIVVLRIKNTNPNRIINVSSQSGSTKVTDEFGNAYFESQVLKQSGQGIWHPIPGHTGLIEQREVRLRSDSPTTDVVIFERPVVGATRLVIDLDAAKYGGEGVIRLTITKAVWEKKLDTVPSEKKNTLPKKK